MIVTAHQPNLLPGRSVIDKLRASDAVLWLDEVQYTKGGFVNRNRMPDGGWFTVPVERLTDGQPINRVRVAEHPPWRAKAATTLRQTYRHGVAELAATEIERPYRLLCGLNVSLLRLLLPLLGVGAAWHFQTHLDAGHAVRVVSDDAAELLPISERLAMMVEEVGGTTYLSGPSGRRYLDEAPFDTRQIEVRYFEWSGKVNDNALTMVTREVRA